MSRRLIQNGATALAILAWVAAATQPVGRGFWLLLLAAVALALLSAGLQVWRAAVEARRPLQGV